MSYGWYTLHYQPSEDWDSFPAVIHISMLTDRLESLEKRYQELENSLTDPEVIKNQDLYHKSRKEHAELAPVIQVFRRYR